MTSQPIRQPLRILGIDPGLRRTGWGLIEIDGNRLAFVGCGSVGPPEGLAPADRRVAVPEGPAPPPGGFTAGGGAGRATFCHEDGLRHKGGGSDAECPLAILVRAAS